jgi:hypothetical protein
LLDEDVELSLEKDDKLAYISSTENRGNREIYKRDEDYGIDKWDNEDDLGPDTEDSSNFIRVVLVTFQHKGTSNKRNLVGITLCAETLEVEEACQNIVKGAKSASAVPIRIV